MRLVSGARYDALDTRFQIACQGREEAEKVAADRQAVIERQAVELTYFRDQHPDAPLPYPKPADGDRELRRQLALARRAIASLDGQLAEAQKANEALTRELREAREGVAS